jgi:hypothetical protein
VRVSSLRSVNEKNIPEKIVKSSEESRKSRIS